MYRPILFAAFLVALVACGDAKPDAAELRADAVKAEAEADKAATAAAEAAAASEAKSREAAAATQVEWREYQAETWNPTWDQFYTSTDVTWKSTEYTFDRNKDSVTITRVNYDKGGRLEDGLLKTAVKAQYTTDKDVTGKNIEVSVTDNVVHLRGQVASRAEAREAVRLAINTRGVHQVISHLTVAG